MFHKSNLSRLQNIINLNISSVVSFTHLLIKDFASNPKGKAIVFVGSGAGIAWMPGSAIYSASKHFITAMAMNLRSELKALGVEVALVAPGPVDSEFDQHAGINNGMNGKKIRRLMNLYLWFPWWLRKRLLENDAKKLITN